MRTESRGRKPACLGTAKNTEASQREREKSVVLWFQFSDSSLNKEERQHSSGAPGREAFTLVLNKPVRASQMSWGEKIPIGGEGSASHVRFPIWFSTF